MKKHFVAIVAILAGMSIACTRVLAPSVDFGSTTYVNDYSSLTAAINDLTKSLSEKLTLIQESIDNGTTTQQQALALIQQAIENLSQQVENGDKSIAEALEALRQAIVAQTTAMETKLAAIEAALTTGFANQAQALELIKAAIESLEAEVKAGNVSQAEALEAIRQAILSQTLSFETKMDAITEALATGLANQAEAIGLVKDAVASLEEEVNAGNIAQADALAKIYDALCDIKDSQDAIGETLTAILNDKGVYPDPKGEYVGLSPELWAYVSANTESGMYKSLIRELPKIDQAARSYQINPAGEQTGHTCLTSTLVSQASVELSATRSTQGEMVIYKVYHIREWMKYRLTVDSSCDWPFIQRVQVIDALGNNTKTISASHTTEVTVYYINTDSLIKNAIINLHCVN